MISGGSANPLSAIKWGNYRITVLTSRCIRIEYNSKLYFEDRPSRTFLHRNHPLPQFQKDMTLDRLKIRTDNLLILISDPRNPPKPSNFTIESTESDFLWDFSSSFSEFSCFDANIGYTIIDDSSTPILNKDGIYIIRTKSEFDFYFFGYGKSVIDGITDFFLISGSADLPPLYSFKISYFAKSDNDSIKIYDNFSSRNIFFGSCFFGTFWHNREKLFSWDPDFLRKIDDLKVKRDLKIGISVEVLNGVSSNEVQYRDIAKELKLEFRETAEYSKKKSSFLSAFQKFVMTPLEKDGVDFFEIDEDLFALNRIYFRRKVNIRPFMLSKYRMFGCQRWPLPLSPKNCKNWKDLSSLPHYFSNLSNRGIVYELFEINDIESYDNDYELIARIFQLAALIPIVRISIPNNFPWNIDSSIACFILNALKFHNELEPFFYSLGYQCVINRRPIITSMSNVYGKENSASLCPSQFCIGSDGDVIAAPFVTKIDDETNFANNAVWLPYKTAWFDFETGREYGGGWHGIHGNLSRIPLFVKAGSIIPTKTFGYIFSSKIETPKSQRNTKISMSKSSPLVTSGKRNDGVLTIHIFPKGSKKFQIFDDGEGDTKAYKSGKFIITTIETRWDFKGFDGQTKKSNIDMDDESDDLEENQKNDDDKKDTNKTDKKDTNKTDKNDTNKTDKNDTNKTDKSRTKKDDDDKTKNENDTSKSDTNQNGIDKAKKMMIVFERAGDASLFNRNREMIIRLHNINPRVKVTTDTNSEITNERIELNDFTFDLKINKFPSVVIVRTYVTGELLCVDRTKMTSADLTSVLKAANMTTWVTQSHMDSLPKGTFFPRLTASSHVLPLKVRLLLLEELEDCGFYHFTREMGNDLFVVWNNSDSDLFTYIYKRFEALKKEEITESSGIVPPALFFSPQKELTVRHRHLVDLPTEETLLELIICDTLMFSIDFDSM